ncbi:flagellar basal-body MS-ring/collar protein FliF [Pararhodobacter oceanensis]|uniref:flagellar basal-body MS-ring/collar protein FliF n=1 Tax=Pararhodobacter oceanensis TaxID=2172121 RepID=UPI003A948AF8
MVTNRLLIAVGQTSPIGTERPRRGSDLDQLLSVWNALELRRKIIVVAATLGMFTAVIVMARIATAPSMALLYAGLDGAPAGEVVAELDQRGQRYEVRGDAIYVDASARDEIRMALAAKGLPANSASGYELLDGLTGFGTTAQMFDAAYWRAKEGELARTIMSSPHIRAARVHLAQGATQPFRRVEQTSASVTVTTAGAPLTQTQAQAFRFLVAAAVSGLEVENVAIIDSNGGVVMGEESTPSTQGSDRAEVLRRNIERLLEARVGPGRAVVEVNVETVTDRETIIERLIDPNGRAAVSQETEERNATSSDSRGAGVSVASNLPDGDAAGGDGRSESREVTTRESVAWEVSQTSREVERGPGAIRRLSVAVLIDGVRSVDASGVSQWLPRPAEELEALRELVASTVGYNEERGDVITLRSLEFESIALSQGSTAGVGLIERLGLDVMGLIRLAALAAVVLFLVLVVLRPLLRPQPRQSEMDLLPGVTGGTAAAVSGPVLTGEIDEDDAAGHGANPADTEEGQSPVERMRSLIAERQDETLEILRNWMEEPEEPR